MMYDHHRNCPAFQAWDIQEAHDNCCCPRGWPRKAKKETIDSFCADDAIWPDLKEVRIDLTLISDVGSIPQDVKPRVGKKKEALI
jgi:hypothetical protein